MKSEHNPPIKTNNVTYDLCWKAAWVDDSNKASLSAIEQWLIDNKTNQDLLQQTIYYKDEIDNDTPLHVLVSARPPRDLVERFIRLAPDILKVLIELGTYHTIVHVRVERPRML